MSQEKSASRYPLMAKADISYINNVAGSIKEFSERIKKRNPKVIVSEDDPEETLRQLRLEDFVKDKYSKVENTGNYVVFKHY